MMNTLFKIFLRQCFTDQPRIGRLLAVNGILFSAFYFSEIRLTIAPFVFYLTSALFSAGLMHQALSSAKTHDLLQHLLMLPYDDRVFVCAYIAALGCHTLLTKTLGVWLLFAAVGHFSVSALLLSVLAAICGIVMAGTLFSREKGTLRCMVAVLIALAVLAHIPHDLPVALALALTLLLCARKLTHCRATAFYRHDHSLAAPASTHRFFLLPRYFLRYLITHKNYLINTLFLWMLAAFLPLFVRALAPLELSTMAFALLTLNTPLGILLSCDPDLQQALRVLPSQARTFCLPYLFFLLSCNLIADGIFLFSGIIVGLTFTWQTAANAFFFAAQSAICTVWLEWQHPIRHWQLESDLWHHPRKYLVPGIMLLLSGLFSIWPKITLFAFCLLGSECLIFFFIHHKKRRFFTVKNG